VVQLQTNFGGGKTHSMLALYHLFSGIAPTELAGVDEVMSIAGASKIPTAQASGSGRQQDFSGQSFHLSPTVPSCARLWGELGLAAGR
jgi:hypothetical protein